MSGIPVGARDLKIDAITGDLVVENGDFVWVTGIDAIAQDIRTAFLMFLEEWFLDPTEGIPYFQSILGQKVSLLVVREIFRRQLLIIPGVLEVLSISATFDSTLRKTTIAWKVSTDLGELTGENTV